MNTFDKEHFLSYYSEEEFEHQINKYDIDIINLDINEIFNLAIKYGIVDLIIYIYVNYNIEYELSNLLIEINNIIPENYNQINLEEKIIYDAGANNSLRLDYMNKEHIQLLKSIKILNSLRKYSKMRSSNKKFYYKFNQKYRYKFYDDLFN